MDVGRDGKRNDVLRRGIALDGHLPGTLALGAMDAIRDLGLSGMDEFLLVAVGSYLDMRRHPDVSALLDLRLFQEATDGRAAPRTYVQVRADLLARLERPLPMTVGEAAVAMA